VLSHLVLLHRGVLVFLLDSLHEVLGDLLLDMLDVGPTLGSGNRVDKTDLQRRS
jgi:hypothetical protein